MESDVQPEAVASPLRSALDGFDTALQHLIKVVQDGALYDLGAAGLVGFLQDFEQVRNTMPVVDNTVIQHGIEQGVPALLCERNMARVLAGGLRLSAAEAGRRVRAAEHLAGRHTMTGEPVNPFRPHLAAAQRAGTITPEHVNVIDTALRGVDGRGFDPAEIEAGERILVEAAASLGPADLRNLAQRVVDGIDPDGVLPDEREHHRRRYLHLRHRPDGSWAGEFRLTPQAGQKFATLLDTLGRPTTTNCHTGGDTQNRDAAQDAQDGQVGQVGQTSTRVDEPDPRTRGQRFHDAWEAMLDRLLRDGTLPETGGTPATVIVTIDADNLADRTGTGRYADGSPVSAATVADLADEADVAFVVKNAKGAVLDLYRTRRIASPAQTLALIARDGGCSFPGCDVEPQWCERHHIVPWIDGGQTNLDNLVLVCRYHHHNFERRGWTCRLNADGLPVWIPPKWIDRHQHPILHPRIRVNNWRPQDPLDDT